MLPREEIIKSLQNKNYDLALQYYEPRFTLAFLHIFNIYGEKGCGHLILDKNPTYKFNLFKLREYFESYSIDFSVFQRILANGISSQDAATFICESNNKNVIKELTNYTDIIEIAKQNYFPRRFLCLDYYDDYINKYLVH